MARRLSQHFLKRDAVERAIALIDPRPGQQFLEIGPGRGALTLPLAARSGRVVAVELDRELAAGLARRAPPNLEVVAGDALAVDLAALVPRGARLAGNLPYAVSSPLLRRFLALRGHFEDAHLMLQEEVARRVSAGPGSRDYGVLSVLFAPWADVDVPLRFPPACFSPPPRVDSAILRVRFRQVPKVPVGDPAAFEALVKASFRHRRKTLENNLQDSYPNLKEYLRLLNIEGRRRAETLSVGEFAALSTRLG